MSANRYNPPIDPRKPHYNDRGGVCYEVDLDTHPQGRFVHYSDYEKLADALREIRSLGPHQLAGEIAEAALLSNGEEL